MIVGGRAQGDERTTLDDLFRRAAVANADGIALADDSGRQLSYAEADRVIWAIAGRLRALGIAVDGVIGVQMPNTVAGALTLLGILRAGMIAALLPMLWRESEIVAALSNISVKAMLTTGRIGSADHAALAMRAAAGLFSIRHVCGFGDCPDGVVALDDVFDVRTDTSSLAPRDGNPAAHAAVVTFEPTPRGIQPVVRNHAQLITGGHAVTSAAELTSTSILLSAMPLASFAALAGIMVPWLMSGGRLVLHQPLDVDAFASRADGANVIALPGALVPAFAGTGRTVIAHWRAPERIDPRPLPGNIVDVISFGEFASHVARRDGQGCLAPPVLGTNYLPGHCPDRPNVLEAKRTPAGTLALRGRVVAKAGFGATDQGGTPDITDGFVDTGYPCRIDPDGYVVIAGPQPGMVSTGGYRIARHDLDQVAATTPFGIVSALPHALLGQRLAGSSPEQSEVQAALEARGLNALIVRAFGCHEAA